MKNPRIALLQTPVCPDKAQNVENAVARIREAAADGADIVVLPEMFCCLYENASFVANREPAQGFVWQALSRAAGENGVYVIGGSMPEEDAGKIYNTCFIFDRQGRQIGRHRKVHLFDIDAPGQRFMESDTFTAGSQVTVVDTEFGKIGVAICFDMRFPELSRLMALSGAQILVYPAAFNMTTGPAHWEVHLRSRAIDNQLYTVACAPARAETGYRSYGHSLCVSPWGTIVDQLAFEPGRLMIDVDMNEITRVRGCLPLMSARRTDVYAIGPTDG